MVNFEFETASEAWVGINKFMCIHESEVIGSGGTHSSNELVMYDVEININKVWVDPDFDFGKTLGYNYKKWTKLVANYVDLNYLDSIKGEIRGREAKKSKDYTYSYHFSNLHGHGKDCLISLVFLRRPDTDWPIVYFHTRASEITKRLLFDFLLIQRICEYVYGEKVSVQLKMWSPMMFLNTEAHILFHNVIPIPSMLNKAIKKYGSLGAHQQRLKKTYEKFSTIDPVLITYKSHKRVAIQIQKNEHGEAISGKVSCFAKDCSLFKDITIPKKQELLLNQLKQEETI